MWGVGAQEYFGNGQDGLRELLEDEYLVDYLLEIASDEESLGIVGLLF